MTTEKQDIQPGTLFSGNPEDLPSDPAEVAALIEKQDAAATAAAKGDTAAGDKPAEGATPGAKDEGKSKADAAKTEGDKPKVDEPKGILTKDGKHVLPYSELVTARNTAREATGKAAAEAKARLDAEAKADALQKQITELQAKREGADKAEEQSDAEFNELVDSLEKENLQAVAKVLKATRSQSTSKITALETTIKELKAQQDELRGTVSTVAKREQASVSQMVDEALDGNAKLRYLRDQKPELYDEAVTEDEALRGTPGWAKLEDSVENFGKRFNTVIASVEARHGAIQLPPEYLSVDDVTKLAKEKVKAAGDFKPNTLTDLPGGAAPGAKPAADAMSATDLYSAMQGMNEDQISDVLSRVA